MLAGRLAPPLAPSRAGAARRRQADTTADSFAWKPTTVDDPAS